MSTVYEKNSQKQASGGSTLFCCFLTLFTWQTKLKLAFANSTRKKCLNYRCGFTDPKAPNALILKSTNLPFIRGTPPIVSVHNPVVLNSSYQPLTIIRKMLLYPPLNKTKIISLTTRAELGENSRSPTKDLVPLHKSQLSLKKLKFLFEIRMI